MAIPLPPYPLNHKLVEFAIGFAMVVFLAWWFGGDGPPRHRK